MAAMKPIQVPCPECGEKVPVHVDIETEYVEGDGLRVTMKPNVSEMADHYAVEHCGAEVSEPT
jgi:hypothetical protein